MTNPASQSNAITADAVWCAIGLAAPARRALIRAQIYTLAQLASWPLAELRQLHGIGPNALRQIEVALANAGLPPLQ